VRTLRVLLLILAAFALAAPLPAEDVNAPETSPKTGHITGTVTDVNDGSVPGATVALAGPALTEPRQVVSSDSGFFEFKDLPAGTYTSASPPRDSTTGPHPLSPSRPASS